MDKNTSWCPLPWKGLSIRNNGDYRVCCQANTSPCKGVLRREDGSTFNAKNSNLNEARNSSLLREIRVAMLENKRHPMCVRCNREDDAGVRSRRHYESEFWTKEFSIADARETTDATGRIEPEQVPLGFYDLRFGNLCNLKCRMCGPTDSSLWHREYFDTVGPAFRDTSGPVTLEKNEDGQLRVQGENPYSWHEAHGFWEQAEKELRGIRKIYVVGGEPLLIERHYELLRKIVASGKAAEVTIEYNSNITVLPEKALDLWKYFKNVRIGASIDCHGKINDYIRHPSRWEIIEKNLDTLDRGADNLTVWIAATVQIYNIFYFTDFLKWKILKGYRKVNASDRLPFVTTHPLHSPAHFNIQALPPAAKSRVEEKFAEFYDSWFLPYLASADFSEEKRHAWKTQMKKLLDGYVAFMRKEDLSQHLEKFVEATATMDRYRKENFAATMPELSELIHGHLSGKHSAIHMHKSSESHSLFQT